MITISKSGSTSNEQIGRYLVLRRGRIYANVLHISYLSKLTKLGQPVSVSGEKKGKLILYEVSNHQGAVALPLVNDQTWKWKGDE